MPDIGELLRGGQLSRRILLRTAAVGAGGIGAAALIGCGGDDEEPSGDSGADGGGATPAGTSAVSNDPRYPRDPDLPFDCP